MTTRKALLVVLWAAAVFSPHVARAIDDPGLVDPFTEHRNRGTELFSAGHYEEAFKAFLGAYAVRKDRELLFDLGRTARELGRSRGALDYLQRYLLDEPSPPTPRGEQAQRMVRELVAEQARSAPVPAAPDAHADRPPGPPRPIAGPRSSSLPSLPGDVRLLPVRVEKRSNTGLIAGGALVFAFSYTAAFTTGVYILNDPYSYSVVSTNGNIRTASGLLVIPFLGPLLTGAAYRERTWWGPWTFLDGMAQLSGLVMMIAGARDKHDVLVPTLLGARVVVSPWAASAGGGLTLSGLF